MITKRLSIFTRHIHGSYLFYLYRGNYDIYIPTNYENQKRISERGEHFHWRNAIKVQEKEVRYLQTYTNYLLTSLKYIIRRAKTTTQTFNTNKCAQDKTFQIAKMTAMKGDKYGNDSL